LKLHPNSNLCHAGVPNHGACRDLRVCDRWKNNHQEYKYAFHLRNIPNVIFRNVALPLIYASLASLLLPEKSRFRLPFFNVESA
jgi:hypothetical protein